MHVLLGNDYLIRVYQSFIANISCYAGIMYNTFNMLTLSAGSYWQDEVKSIDPQ